MPELQVVDVAHWDFIINIPAMIEAGAIGLYAKATTGSHGVDSKFMTYRQQAETAVVQEKCQKLHGCPFFFGAYHWLDGSDPHDQVANFLTHTQGVHWRILDFEDATCPLATAVAATHLLQQKAGRFPSLYGGDKSYLGVACDNGHFIGAVDLILARNFPNKPSHPCRLWQYSPGESPTTGPLIGGKSYDLNTYVGHGTCADWLKSVTS